MSENFIDVHTFDGKLKDIINVTKHTTEFKKTEFEKFRNSLKDHYSINTLNCIINDMYNQNGQNYQIENDLDVSDVLINILIHNNYSNELFAVLNEQLGDVSKYGLCNSGRVTRLLQILLSLS